MTKDSAKQLALNTVCQNNSLWSDERKRRITGSNCYSIFTYTKNKNPDWAKKVQSLYFSTFRGNENTDYGLSSENDAVVKYSEACQKKILKCGLIVHPEFSFLGFSPDGLIVENCNSIKLLEVKSPTQGMFKTATELVDHLDYLRLDHFSKYVLKEKDKYYGQVQLGLFLTGCQQCDFIIYSSYDDSFFKVIVSKDEKFLLQLLPCLADVYFKHILPAVIE